MRTHIMPLEDTWYVRVEGGQGLMDFTTQDEAFQKCQELIGSCGGLIVIHDADGSPKEQHDLRAA